MLRVAEITLYGPVVLERISVLGTFATCSSGVPALAGIVPRTRAFPVRVLLVRLPNGRECLCIAVTGGSDYVRRYSSSLQRGRVECRHTLWYFFEVHDTRVAGVVT